MGYIVQKFGGTSLAGLDLIKKTALHVKSERDTGSVVIVVVSAMAGVTNTLASYVNDLSTTFDRAEYDTVISSGEQITAGLLSLALQNIGVPSRSYMGWQIPILTSAAHTQAKIEHIDCTKLIEQLNNGVVPIIAGFQGITKDGRITTLGRGGSDTTAVAVAAALKADRCDIYTDVDGVYTADPRYVSSADKLDHIGYHEMLELAAQGAKVLHKDSVEYAMKHKVPLRVLSSKNASTGTLVTAEGDLSMRKQNIRGLAHSFAEHRITVKNVPANAILTRQLKDLMAREKIEIGFFNHHLTQGTDFIDYSFTVSSEESHRAHPLLQKMFPVNEILIDHEVAKISVIGTGLINDFNPSQLFFKTLKQKGVNIYSVAASDIKLSVLIHSNDAGTAIESLHTVYQLDTEEREWNLQNNN